jgi:DNA-directed RNA polymerase specialized sigma24 family protein
MTIIPFGYKELPPEQQAVVTPICVASHDSTGTEIDHRWFTDGVAPIYRWLLGCAHRVLGDRLRASEITERAVHALWRRHGSELGTSPQKQVKAEASWAAKDVRSERSMSDRRYMVPLEGTMPVVDRKDYSRIYEARLDLDIIMERMRRDGQDLEYIATKLLDGYSYQDIASELGLEVETVWQRVCRWRKDNVIAPACVQRTSYGRILRRRCRTVREGPEGSSTQQLP